MTSWKKFLELQENYELSCPKCGTKSDDDLTISDYDEKETEDTNCFCHCCGEFFEDIEHLT